jgi:Fe-S-cluster-containing dehydrogenase component
MTYSITSQCIGCDRCQTLCPTGAIQTVQGTPTIDPNLCNNCVGHYGVAQCWAACPTSHGCIPGTTAAFSPAALQAYSGDYWERWFATYNQMISRLHQTQNSAYWERWFDIYSQKISKLLPSHQVVGA